MKRSTRRGWRFLLILAFAMGVWFVMAWVAGSYLIVNRAVPNAEVTVVLSGAATFSERTHYAAQIFRERRTKQIILTDDNLLSGWSAKEQRNPYYFERALSELVRSGVPRDKIEVLEPPVTDTFDEAVRLRAYCDARQLPSL